MSDDFAGGGVTCGGGEAECQPSEPPRAEATEQIEILSGQVLINEQLLTMHDDTLTVASGISLRESNLAQGGGIAWSLRRQRKHQPLNDA